MKLSAFLVFLALSSAQAQTASFPLPGNEELPLEIQETLEKLPALNVYRMVANVPKSFQPYIDLAQSIFSGNLNPKLREIIFLRTAKDLPSSYEWHQHVFLGKGTGLTDRQIETIQKEGSVKSLDEEGNFICKVCDELTKEAKLTNATFNQLLQRYPVELGSEIILSISFANMLGRYINGTRVPIEKTNPLEGLSSPTQ